MAYSRCFAALALTILSLTAIAQQNDVPPHPADAGASVPPVSYQSAFRNYQPYRDVQATPDQVWRATNDEMGKLGGHIGHIKDEAPASATSQAPAMPTRRHVDH